MDVFVIDGAVIGFLLFAVHVVWLVCRRPMGPVKHSYFFQMLVCCVGIGAAVGWFWP